MNYFVVADPIKCIGCRTCMIACVVEHNGEDIFYQNPEEINFNPKLEVVKNAQVSAPINVDNAKMPLVQRPVHKTLLAEKIML